tara:strand:+ start:100 stop:1053 length:954 start_codon:yes stop_codon:yes gene_type:complete
MQRPRRIRLALILLASSCSYADRLHFVIPAGPGGGLDGTAREIGRIFKTFGQYESISYENMPGGGGGRALSQYLENRSRYQDAVLVNSTPLIVRSLQGLFPQSFRDLTPIVGLIADYGIFVVRADDPILTWSQLSTTFKSRPSTVVVGGGSVRGSLDHIVLALALSSINVNPREVRYLPYDGGAKAILALLSGEVRLLSTGLGETMPFLDSGQVRALAVTAAERIETIADVPTLQELGHDVVFANWRGIFAQPQLPTKRKTELIEQFHELRQTNEWNAALQKRGWTPLDLAGNAFANYLLEQEKLLRTTLSKLGFIN